MSSFALATFELASGQSRQQALCLRLPWHWPHSDVSTRSLSIHLSAVYQGAVLGALLPQACHSACREVTRNDGLGGGAGGGEEDHEPGSAEISAQPPEAPTSMEKQRHDTDHRQKLPRARRMTCASRLAVNSRSALSSALPVYRFILLASRCRRPAALLTNPAEPSPLFRRDLFAADDVKSADASSFVANHARSRGYPMPMYPIAAPTAYAKS